MAKKNNSKWLIILAIIGLALFLQPGGITKTSDNVKSIADSIKQKFSGGGGGVSGVNLGNPDKDFISLRLYDENGKQIIVPPTYSIVNTVPGVTSFDYTVGLNNTGVQDLTCQIVTITPAVLDQINPKTETVAKKGQRVSWTSSLISAAPLEGSTYTLDVEVSCWYYDGDIKNTLTNKHGTMSITITSSSGGADYTVLVNVGNLPTEYCGDDSCTFMESTRGTCPSDCSVIPNTQFRTSDPTYTSGSAIAWNLGSCAATVPLTRYSYVDDGVRCYANTAATCPTMTGYTTRITSGIPGGPSWATTGTGCLYQNSTSSGKMLLAFKQPSATSGPCTTALQWGTISYDSAISTYLNKVENQLSSLLDSKREKNCP